MSDAFVATFEIVNKLGLHARAAAKLVKEASRFNAEIKIERDGQSVDAKSIMGVLLLCASRGSFVTVRAMGSDAQQAVEAIGALIAARFFEDA